MEDFVAFLRTTGLLSLMFAAIVFFARVERPLNDFVASLLEMVNNVFHLLADTLDDVRGGLGAAATRLRGGVPVDPEPAADGTAPEPEPPSPRAGPLATVRSVVEPLVGPPLVFAICAAVLLSGDIYLAVLRGASMFGFTPNETIVSSAPLQLVASFLYVPCAVVFGALLFEVLHVVDLNSPFTRAKGKLRKILVVTAVVGFLASAALGGVQQVWGQRAIEGFRDRNLAEAYAFGSIVLASIAAGLAVVGALNAPRLLGYLLTLLLGPVLGVLHWSACAISTVITGFGEATDKLLDFAGTPGAFMWDWICDFGFASRAHLQPIRDRHRPVTIVVPEAPLEPEPMAS